MTLVSIAVPLLVILIFLSVIYHIYHIKVSRFLEAIRKHDIEKVKKLIAKGGVVSRAPELLQVAVESGDEEMVSLLIAKGANVNPDPDGKSVLQIAVESGDKEMVSLLIAKGANVNFDPDGKSVLQIAVEKHDKEIVSLLVDKGAYVSPYFIKTAIVNHDNEIVQLLVEKCESLNSIYDGKTILDLAENDEIIGILKKHGAKTKAELDKETAEKARRIAEEAELQTNRPSENGR